METQTVTVPTRGSGETSISGEVVGPFLIHRPAGAGWFLGPKLWHVTHIKTGMRFPWEFEKKNTARRFCRLVRKMTDWEQVGCRIEDPTSARGTFTTNLPTEEQRKNIKALALALTSTHETKT